MALDAQAAVRGGVSALRPRRTNPKRVIRKVGFARDRAVSDL